MTQLNKTRWKSRNRKYGS